MIKNKEHDYLIKTESIKAIITNMNRNGITTTPIMLDRIVKRALYRVENPEDGKKQWIRIMEGDIECTGEIRCTITYKDREEGNVSEDKEDYALLKVDNFDDATHLFDLLKYERDSYQENKRSKFICVMEGVKYIVRFDIWPKIEDVIFVSITVISSASSDDLKGFISALDIDNLCIKKDNVDVDDEYREKTKKTATEISNLTFDSDF
jgi:hypothetical protein